MVRSVEIRPPALQSQIGRERIGHALKCPAGLTNYIRSFLNIADPQIRKVVEGELNRGKVWPEPLLQFNPAFEIGGKVSVSTLIDSERITKN